MALEEFTESQLIEKLPWIPWCHCELKSKPASLPGSLLSGSPQKNHCLPAKIGLLIGTKKKFRPLVVLTRLSIAHYFIIMCHLWVWPANNHQWKEETKSKSAHYSLHSSKNISFEKQIIFFAPILSTIKNSNNLMTSLCFILLKFTRFSEQNFQRIVFQM